MSENTKIWVVVSGQPAGEIYPRQVWVFTSDETNARRLLNRISPVDYVWAGIFEQPDLKTAIAEGLRRQADDWATTVFVTQHFTDEEIRATGYADQVIRPDLPFGRSVVI